MNTPRENGSTTSSDEQLAEKATKLFEESVERIDAATLSQLNQRRQEALAELSTAKPLQHWLRWMPAGGLAAAAVLAVVMFRGPGVPDLPVAPDTAMSDFEILISDDSFEMIEELEFYSWIDMAELESPDNVG